MPKRCCSICIGSMPKHRKDAAEAALDRGGDGGGLADQRRGGQATQQGEAASVLPPCASTRRKRRRNCSASPSPGQSRQGRGADRRGPGRCRAPAAKNAADSERETACRRCGPRPGTAVGGEGAAREIAASEAAIAEDAARAVEVAQADVDECEAELTQFQNVASGEARQAALGRRLGEISQRLEG